MAFDPRQGYDPKIGQRYSNSHDVVTGATVAGAPAITRAGFLQKVYAAMTVGVLISMGTAFALLQQGIEDPQGSIVVQVAHNYLMVGLIYLALTFGASLAARVRILNISLFIAFALVTGLRLSPLFVLGYQAGGYALIWNALGMTCLLFGGLTGYVFISGKDFSFLGGTLSMGIMVLLGFMVGTFFFDAPAYQMGVTVGGLLLFGLFVLYDTSVIMRSLAPEEWVAGALHLFIDFINLFIRILFILIRISGAARR